MQPRHPTRDQIRLADVLGALGNPLRLKVLKVLSDGSEHPCGSILEGVSKPTLTHHWRVLRDAGVICQRPAGRELLVSLRRADLDARFPGLIESMPAALKEETKESH